MMIGNRISAALAAIVAACALTGVASAQTQSVVVYSAVSPKVMTAFVEEFQKQNPGIKVDLISGGSGELLTRLQAEKANPRADVLVGPDADNFDAYHRPLRELQVDRGCRFPARRGRTGQQVLRLLDELPGVHRQHEDDAASTRRRRRGRTSPSPSTRARS